MIQRQNCNTKMLEDTSGNQENAGQEQQLSYISRVVAGREEVCELYRLIVSKIRQAEHQMLN